MGIFPLILAEVGRMGLNSHLYTSYYAPISLSHVDVRAKAHHLYTLQILRCISSTILICEECRAEANEDRKQKTENTQV